MSVQGLINKGLDKKEWKYRLRNVCNSAATYKRNLRLADSTDETLKDPICEKTDNFKKLTPQEEKTLL